MLLAVRLVMLVLGLATAALGIAGIVALVQRRGSRGFWFGLASTAGGIGSYVLVGILGSVAFTRANAGWYLPVEGGAEVLADTISGPDGLRSRRAVGGARGRRHRHDR